jgi:hypothetical protein
VAHLPGNVGRTEAYRNDAAMKEVVLISDPKVASGSDGSYSGRPL